MNKVGVWFDPQGVEDIIRDNPALRALESEKIQEIADTARNQFIVDFGFEPSFKIEMQETQPSLKYGTSRMSYRLCAGDARTTATLKSQPGWFSQFI